jgi:HD superfamily phosphohydrolase
MFSEVYWHHGVRSATAMLQRAFYLLHGSLDLDPLFRMNEPQMIVELLRVAERGPAGELLDGLFGPTRRLYKRVAQYSFFEHPDVYARLARRPYPWLVACAEQFAAQASSALGRVVAPHEILFDAPPIQREVELNVDVFFAKEKVYRPLVEVSPVIRTLAREQFDDYVKRVRIFAAPRVAADLQGLSNLPELLSAAIGKME